ncbi:hypothetical protein MIMGU_mgv1a017134mg [Erythranthe guttata]|nr:hypothetical protein MIMGU_mgv1a017134mg [Erythranthe guttata]
MGKSISEVGVEDLVGAGLTVEEAMVLGREIKDAIGDSSSNCAAANENWAEIMSRNLLKPWHPHPLHQLIYYSVYHSYDDSVNGPPLYCFPSP